MCYMLPYTRLIYVVHVVMMACSGLCPPQEDPGPGPGPAAPRAEEEGPLEWDRRRSVRHLYFLTIIY